MPTETEELETDKLSRELEGIKSTDIAKHP